MILFEDKTTLTQGRCMAFTQAMIAAFFGVVILSA
ncbi:MAG: hypothetical protein ACI9WC_000839 [Arenicella sp.]|jgi:hypothetical protein